MGLKDNFTKEEYVKESYPVKTSGL